MRCLRGISPTNVTEAHFFNFLRFIALACDSHKNTDEDQKDNNDFSLQQQ